MNIQRYIDGENVRRDRISKDIKNGVIDEEELRGLIKDERITKSFFENVPLKKIPANEWDKSYLEELSYKVIGEVFTEKFLLYLLEVSKKVNKDAKRNKVFKLITLGITVLLFFALVAYGIYKLVNR